MKFIEKNPEPTIFTKWKKNNPRGIYEKLDNAVRREVRLSLITEQKGLCCYCCGSIKIDSSHIDHYKPRSVGSLVDQLDYNNMHASCEGIHHSAKNCGKVKDAWFNPEEMVSPLNPECETYFQYNVTGAIEPASGKERVKKMIDNFGLNYYELQAARAAAIKTTGLLTVGFDETQRQEWLQIMEDVDLEGNLLPFCTAVIYCLRNNP
nr:retron system putative HNH endonuclease [uncultured Anaeromusa sp.]